MCCVASTFLARVCRESGVGIFFLQNRLSFSGQALNITVVGVN